jgi:amino acid adenylation domain-containing protein
LVTQSGLEQALAGHGARPVRLDADWAAIAERPAEAPASGAGPDNLAYVIYTSGSTGRPKGVMIAHRSASAYISYLARDLLDGRQLRILQIPPISFDPSIRDILGTLLSGGTLHLLPAKRSREPAYIREVIETQAIQAIIAITPTLLSMLVLDAPAKDYPLQLVAVSGEALDAKLLAKTTDVFRRAKVLNIYGPTEITMTCAEFDCALTRGSNSVEIGRPIANKRLYVLDANLSPVPVGVRGELYVAGDGIARGYLGRPALTAERFIPDPFGNGERLYRTGDEVRHLSDDNLEFLGRLDQQVKVRGYRIELGEIETALRGHAQVKQAVVVAREDDPGDKRLVAYVVPSDLAAVDGNELRRHLKQLLPEFMIPSAFVTLDRLPVTPNGKLDHRALPAPEGRGDDIGYVAPRNAVEQTLASIWTEVLRVEQIGIHDNFFELGGHSLLATRVVARVRHKLGIDMSLRMLFEAPRIEALAEALAELERDRAERIATLKRRIASMSPEEVRAELQQLSAEI